MDHSERKHSEWGGSGAKRWTECPGSIKSSRLVPDKEAGYAAQEGTCAHELSEYCLENLVNPKDCIGKIFNEINVDDDMAYHIQGYCDYIYERLLDLRCNFPDAELIVEKELDLSYLREGMFGSGDVIIYSKTCDLLILIDLKYGRGYVDAYQNLQLGYYGCGARDTFTNVKKVEGVIYQPRAGSVPDRSYTFTSEDLDNVEEKMGLAYDDSLSDSPTYKEGDHCLFCPAKSMCPIKTKDMADMFGDTGTDITPPVSDSELSLVNNDYLGELLSRCKKAKKFIAAVEDLAESRAQEGDTPTGYEFKEGRKGHSKWSQEEDVLDHIILADTKLTLSDLTTAKTKSPAQMKKLVNKDLWGELQEFIVTPAGKNVLKEIKPQISESEFTATGD